MGHFLVDWIGYWAVRLLACCINALPFQWALAVGRFLGAVFYYCHKRKRVAYVNLKAAFGTQYTPRELKRIARRTYVHIAQIAVEMFRFPYLDEAYVDTYVQMDGMERIPQALKKGKGLMFLTGHFGNWELMGIASAIRGFPMKILAREQKHSRLNGFLNRLRSTHDNEVIGKGMAVREIMQALRHNEIVAFASDQSGGPDGVYVDLFDRKTSTPPGVISIAQRTGCVVLPAFIVRKQKGRQHVCVHEPLEIPATGNAKEDVKVGLRNYLQLLEQYVRKYPDQWLWGHKRWKYTLNRSVVFLTDDKAGHRSQVQALLELFEDVAQEKGLQLTTEICTVRYKSEIHRMFLFVIAFLCGRWMQGYIPFLRFFLLPESYEKVRTAYADVVVSCGASAVPLNILLKHENGAKNIAIMKPPFPYNHCNFDLMLIPQHDYCPVKRKNIIKLTVALSPTDTDKLKSEGKKLKEKLMLSNNNIMSVLVGGDTKDYVYDVNMVEKTIDELIRLTRERNGFLLVTTSRRTRPDIIHLVKEKLFQEDCCKLLVIPTENNIENIVYGMIDVARIIIVTEDSVSMISESVQSGKPVIVIKMAKKGISKKHVRFQNNLIDEKLITVNTYENISNSFRVMMKRRGEKQPYSDEKDIISNALRNLI
ncbi:MAG: mitochondrial fission ELM1 family protein [Candidatus Omnitrophica bacterium]|nr:mitochondrial fission ELM1 family protein [Candidatus Omnitrophota bacterium]